MPTEELDKDLAVALQAAKRKPRNFAIIAKGVNVLKLLVDKKPIKEGALLKAKKECHGNLIVKGVVQGDGPELVFRVVEEPSIAEPKFKKFITDSTGLTLKPRFQVVSEVQEVDDSGPDEGLEGETKAGGPEPAKTEAPGAPPAPGKTTAEPKTAPTGGKVAYAKLLLAWDAAKKKVHASLQALEKAILESFQGDAGLPEVTARVRQLDGILAGLDDELQDTLDKALNADDAAKPALHQAALAIIARYRGYIDNDSFIQAIDQNPYNVSTQVQKTLGDTLAVLAKQLQGA